MSESISPLASPKSEVAETCSVCGLEAAEPGYATLLCGSCRNRLARRPFPLLIKLSALFLVVALAFALTRFERSIRAGIAFDQGRRAEKKPDYERAAESYKEVVALFPDSVPALVRLAKAHYRAGHLNEAASALQRLAGRRIPRDLASDYERVFREVKYQLHLR